MFILISSIPYVLVYELRLLHNYLIKRLQLQLNVRIKTSWINSTFRSRNYVHQNLVWRLVNRIDVDSSVNFKFRLWTIEADTNCWLFIDCLRMVTVNPNRNYDCINIKYGVYWLKWNIFVSTIKWFTSWNIISVI